MFDPEPNSKDFFDFLESHPDYHKETDHKIEESPKN